jgi:hypothetical protein
VTQALGCAPKFEMRGEDMEGIKRGHYFPHQVQVREK